MGKNAVGSEGLSWIAGFGRIAAFALPFLGSDFDLFLPACSGILPHPSLHLAQPVPAQIFLSGYIAKYFFVGASPG
jgi:hypothetical protein